MKTAKFVFKLCVVSILGFLTSCTSPGVATR